MAHKKSGGAIGKNRDSRGKRLGVKIFGGQAASPGSIIVRQKGTKFHPGLGVSVAKDYSLFAIAQGVVRFRRRLGKIFVDVS